MSKLLKCTFLLLIVCQFVGLACNQANSNNNTKIQNQVFNNKQIIPAAEQLEEYLPLLKNKKVALVVNQTSVVGKTHLVDTLLSNGVDIRIIFAPEHGFRGTADAGEQIKNEKDTKTGLPIVSLYGNTKKPTKQNLSDVDIVIFDIQDVGVRFYTYISTMHYVMEACAENGKSFIVLDRPNPNGSYVDGPVLEPAYKSFVGMHPIPIVHGLTVGELALMINGEKWLDSGKVCNLQVIKVKNYDHTFSYSLPVKPSPNLPNDLSITLYPSLGLFEGTVISVGRGTEMPFQVIGSPNKNNGNFTFTPKSTAGAKNPPYEGQLCYGIDMRTKDVNNEFTLSYLIEMYEKAVEKDKFFNNFFNKLAGNNWIQEQIKKGNTEKNIKQLYQEDLNKYLQKRKKYLLYKDFY
ncbi:MAG: exo-beta-N-acetylmuramidase NamZ domain-containing protein [Cytophagaceae bacterium]